MSRPAQIARAQDACREPGCRAAARAAGLREDHRRPHRAEERKAREAIKPLTEANALLDTWIGRFELGRAYFEAGAFTQADSEFDRCIQRRGEALSLFLDEDPTYGYLPSVYYYQGRVREELKTAGFAESYRAYLNIRGKSTEDPLAADVRKRARPLGVRRQKGGWFPNQPPCRRPTYL